MVLLLILNLVAYTYSWQSEKVVVDEDGCLSYPADAEGNRIPDFSYTRYRYGEIPIPDIEVVVTVGPVTADNTLHIQNALDQVGGLPLNAQGFRGAVLLEPGTYEIHGSLYINASGVVLRGSGDGEDSTTNTLLLGVGNTPHQRDIVRAGGNSNTRWGGKVAGTEKNIATPFVQVGAYSFDVENTDNLAIGDNIIIFHPGTQAWVDDLDGGGSSEGS